MSKRSISLIRGIILDNNQREEKTRILQAKMADGLVVKYMNCKECSGTIMIKMSLCDYITALTHKDFHDLVCDKCYDRLTKHSSAEYLTYLLEGV